MSAVFSALLADATEDELKDLAQRLAPYLVAPLAPEDQWLRGAEAIAQHIGAPPSRVYALKSAGRIPPVHHDGSALVARKSELDAWVIGGGAKRP